MRRPLKPFVTEYKGSSRRNAPASIEQVSFESERPGPKPFDMALRAEPDDSYDAAMRAADALFSIPSPSKPLARDPDQTRDASQPYFDDSRPERSPPEKMGGRILRVIDEPPSPELATLEAERAPKRRGRKPGSKNKPKVAAPQLVHVNDDAPAPPALVERPSIIAPAAPASKALVIAAAAADQTAPTRRTKRFPWMRDKLKPGEEWKRRRLPPICW